MQRNEIAQMIVKRLDTIRPEIEREWTNPSGTRTRHFVVDALLPEDIADAVASAFPLNGSGFRDQKSFRERKRTSALLSEQPAILREITHAFQTSHVVRVISNIVRANDLEPDPSLYAGGLSMMFQGDFLNPHIDNSHDAQRNRYRRLNLLYYANRDWQEENGGNFELWDDDVKVPRTIVSHFNRLVVMETNRHSWHSVSPVIANRPRCCVSNYYFSQVSPGEGQEYFHPTSFTGRPGETFKRTLGPVDNALRSAVSQTLNIGRGKHLVNKE